MTEPTIRPTTQADIPDLKGVLDGTGLFPSEMLADMLAPSLAGEAEALWLTFLLGGSAAGFCYTQQEHFAEGTWNMLALAVHPKLRGKGLGTALVGETERRLKDRGRILIVDTSGTADFALTRKFYAQNGYEEEARIRDFWAAGDDKVTFRKAL